MTFRFVQFTPFSRHCCLFVVLLLRRCAPARGRPAGAWVRFAELEASLPEVERARAIFELAVQQPVLDMPERLWKAYVDFEIAQREIPRARQLYQRLLEKTDHTKVAESVCVRARCAALARSFVRTRAEYPLTTALVLSRSSSLPHPLQLRGAPEAQLLAVKEQRAAILEAWRTMERRVGDQQTLKVTRDPTRRARARAACVPACVRSREGFPSCAYFPFLGVGCPCACPLRASP